MTQEKNLLERVLRAQADLQNDSLFHEVFASTCDLLLLEDIDVSKALPVDRTTVNRWRNGKSVPRPLMRQPIYRFLAARLRKRIKSDTEKPPRDGVQERLKSVSA